MRPDAIEISPSTPGPIPDEPAAREGAWSTLGRFAGAAGRRLLRALCSPRLDLSAFSDAQLRDIGLSRVEVERPGSPISELIRRST